jgi:hypothetical protein
MYETASVIRRPAADATLPRLWLAAGLALGVLLHWAMWRISEPPTLFSDFYKAYYPAAEHVWAHGLGAPWPFTEAGAGGFVNLPIVVVLFLPFVPLGEDSAGWAFLAIGLAGLLLTFHLLTRVAGVRSGTVPWMSMALLLVVNGPLVNSLREGNATHIILLLLTLSVLLLRAGRPSLAGAVIGLCAILKLPLLLLLPYLLWRRRWQAALAASATIASIVAVSWAAFGLEAHIDWLKTSVLPFLNGVIPAFNVQSLDGFLIRLVTGAQQLRDWDPIPRSTPHNAARVLLLAGLLGTTYAVLRRSSASRDGRARTVPGEASELELALMVMLAIVCSPVAWTHYYLLMLLPWAMVLRGLIAQSFDRGVRTLLLASIVLSSLPVLDVPDGPALVREILARTLISAWLFGGLALIAALLMLCWRQARRGAERVGSGPSLAEGLEVGAACAAEQSALPAAPRPGSRP